jgi:hypothetical protein
MDWQWPLAGLCTALAAAYLGWRTWRTWARKAAGCGGGCSCPSKAASPPANGLISGEQLTHRLRGRG